MGLHTVIEAPEIAVLEAAHPGLTVRVNHPLRVLSENIVPADWLQLANSVREQVTCGADAVLILHGTDTMTYTASALAFLLNDLPVPVVLTGANVAPSHEGSDAIHNVHDAIVALGRLGRGVFISFAGSPKAISYIHAATRVRKLRASGQTFYSVNRSPVAHVEDGVYVADATPYPPEGAPSQPSVEDRVLALRLYPGMNFNLLRQSVLPGGMRGVVIELYPSATGPDLSDAFSLPRFIRLAVRSGVLVVTTQADSPRHELPDYPSTLAIREAGGLFLSDCLPETALTKLMWALGQSKDIKIVSALMERSLADELAR